MRPGLQLLTILTALAATCGCNLLQKFFYTRTFYHLGRHNDDTNCDLNLEPVLTVDGSLKLTTAPLPPGSRESRICNTQLQPFGYLVRKPQGIRFWFLRIRATRLIQGQKLAIVTLDNEISNYKTVENDQRFDIDHRSEFPAIHYLKYRYVKLYWETTPAAEAKNVVNITVSLYALFNDSLPTEKRRSLCSRYGNIWCPAASVCVSPGSCTLLNDCFDRFTDPIRCRDTAWLGSSNSSLIGPGTGGTWLSRNLPWLAFCSVPLFLVFALIKICSQKRELDIDDDYVYKLSNGEAGGDGAGGDGNGEEDELNRLPYEDEPRMVSPSRSRQSQSRQQQHHQRQTQRQAERKSQRPASQKSRPPPPPPPSPPSFTTVSSKVVDEKSVDRETGEERESPDGAPAPTAAPAIGDQIEERRSSCSSSPPPPRPPPRQRQKKMLLNSEELSMELKSPRQRSATVGKAKAPQPPSQPASLNQRTQTNSVSHLTFVAA